ncbi:hypothetical protein [Bacillus sp. FJAT-27245]|uniref:hypothetical protein n=1 Tax=Bacillus sp. FJAT-27245 TaxID=1684144 RepID=UPI0006A7E6CB|nr:hypothetical protein [Bacillus sp. FJAT-27245]
MVKSWLNWAWAIIFTILMTILGNEANAKLGDIANWYQFHMLISFWILVAYIIIGTLFFSVKFWVGKIYKDQKSQLIDELTKEVQNKIKKDYRTSLSSAKSTLKNEAEQKVISTLKEEKPHFKKEIKEIVIKELRDEFRHEIDREKKHFIELIEEKMARFDDKKSEIEKIIGAQQYQQSITHVQSEPKFTIEEFTRIITEIGTQHKQIPVPEGIK